MPFSLSEIETIPIEEIARKAYVVTVLRKVADVVNMANDINRSLPSACRQPSDDILSEEIDRFNIAWGVARMSDASRKAFLDVLHEAASIVEGDYSPYLREQDYLVVEGLMWLLHRLGTRSKQSLVEGLYNETKGYILIKIDGAKSEARFRYDIAAEERVQWGLD